LAGQRRLNEGTLSLPVVMNGLQIIIEGRLVPCLFPIWKTIKLGTRDNISYRDAIAKAGMKVGIWGQAILQRTPTQESMNCCKFWCSMQAKL